MDITINGLGINRTVLLIGRYAFKVPCMRYRGQRWRTFLLGLLSNMQEARVGKSKLPSLCPVVASLPGGFLVVMRRARPLTAIEWYHFDADAFIQCEDGGILPVEDKQDSFGVLDGRVVAVDYGS